MDKLRNTIHGIYKTAAETVLPTLSKSQFDDKRVITPQEFVQAGDYLVRVCPTWTWEAGDSKKAKPYLPATRQYLVTRNVPCMQRATDFETAGGKDEYALGGEEEGWVATHTDPEVAPSATAEVIPSMDDGAGEGQALGQQDEDDIPDIGDLDLDDEAAVPVGTSATAPGYLRATEPADTVILRTRTYDLYITYDKYYQVPRFWLVGFDEARQPLTPSQILEDVSEEHARKTITVEPHPHVATSAATIHPCRHAEVMKKLADNLLLAGKEFLVDHYLVLFLKFISSVLPTIQYDHTLSVGDS